jgi:hypothetical protein
LDAVDVVGDLVGTLGDLVGTLGAVVGAVGAVLGAVDAVAVGVGTVTALGAVGAVLDAVDAVAVGVGTVTALGAAGAVDGAGSRVTGAATATAILCARGLSCRHHRIEPTAAIIATTDSVRGSVRLRRRLGRCVSRRFVSGREKAAMPVWRVRKSSSSARQASQASK